MNNLVVSWARAKQCHTEVVVIITYCGGNFVIRRGMNPSDVSLCKHFNTPPWPKAMVESLTSKIEPILPSVSS